MTVIPLDRGDRSDQDGRPVLEARGLTKHFPVRGGARQAMVHAVEDVTLTLPDAGITAVVGESGSGKSTLARMLAQLIKPTAGAVLLDGEAAPGRQRYARQVQLVLQDPFSSLNPVHSVRYHLARPLQIHGINGASMNGPEWTEPGQPGRRPAHPGVADSGGPVRRQVPARVVRRAAAAGGDRAGARRPAAGTAGRRTGVHARRVYPARRAQPAGRPARARGSDHPLRHARHRVGALPGRRDHGHVRGPGHRVRSCHAGHRRTRAPVHAAAAVGRARSGPGAAAVAGGPWGTAEPDPATARLPVPPALPARHAGVRPRTAPSRGGRTGPFQCVLAARAGPHPRPGPATFWGRPEHRQRTGRSGRRPGPAPALGEEKR